MSSNSRVHLSWFYQSNLYFRCIRKELKFKQSYTADNTIFEFMK